MSVTGVVSLVMTSPVDLLNKDKFTELYSTLTKTGTQICIVLETLLEISISNGKTQYRLPCSMAIC